MKKNQHVPTTALATPPQTALVPEPPTPIVPDPLTADLNPPTPPLDILETAETSVERGETAAFVHVDEGPFVPAPEEPAWKNLTPWNQAISERLFRAVDGLMATNTTERQLIAAQQTLHAEIIRVLVQESQDRVDTFLDKMLALIADNLKTTFSMRMRMRTVNTAFTPAEREEFCALVNMFCDLATVKQRKSQLAKFKWSSLAHTLIPDRHDVMVTKLKNYFFA